MSALVDFLLERIAEEEVWARLAPAGIVERLRDQGERVAERYGDPEPPEDGEGVSLADAMWWTTRDAADWIARHDPARVLAECEAKRRIVAMAAEAAEAAVNVAVAVKGLSDAARARMERAGYAQATVSLRGVLEFLALPYASHPDYDERWLP